VLDTISHNAITFYIKLMIFATISEKRSFLKSYSNIDYTLGYVLVDRYKCFGGNLRVS